MSHPITLLKQDHLIIKGRRYEVVEPEETLECFELDFTIQANGKMANFQNSFITDVQDGSAVGIENVWEWLLIVRVLFALGYSIVQEDVRYPDLLEKWIQQIKDADKEEQV